VCVRLEGGRKSSGRDGGCNSRLKCLGREA
jgi:hypothetical protein